MSIFVHYEKQAKEIAYHRQSAGETHKDMNTKDKDAKSYEEAELDDNKRPEFIRVDDARAALKKVIESSKGLVQ